MKGRRRQAPVHRHAAVTDLESPLARPHLDRDLCREQGVRFFSIGIVSHSQYGLSAGTEDLKPNGQEGPGIDPPAARSPPPPENLQAVGAGPAP